MSGYVEEQMVAKRGGYVVYRLKSAVGGRTHTLWGDDVDGRFARIAAFRSQGEAIATLMTLVPESLPK